MMDHKRSDLYCGFKHTLRVEGKAETGCKSYLTLRGSG